MFRKLTTTDPKKARQLFLLLVTAASIVGVSIVVCAIILRNWLLLAIWLIAEADMVATAMRNYAVGWPGSRLDRYTRFPRVSEAQWLLAGLVFLIATVPLLLHDAPKEVTIGLTGLVSAVWLFRFVRVMQKEGWHGKPTTRSS